MRYITLDDLIRSYPKLEKFPRYQVYFDIYGNKKKNYQPYILRNRDIQFSLSQSYEKIDGQWYAINHNQPYDKQMAGADGRIKELARIEDPAKWRLDTLADHYDFVEKSITVSRSSFDYYYGRYSHEAEAYPKLGKNLASTSVKIVEKPDDLIKLKFARTNFAGENLLDFCIANQEALILYDYLHLCYAVAEDLKHVHDSGLLHNDVKPGNIMVSSSEDSLRTNLVDFADWRPINDKEPFTEGNIVYMAPEVFCNQRISEASDIYSLGATIAETLMIIGMDGVEDSFFPRRALHLEIIDLTEQFKTKKLTETEFATLRDEVSQKKDALRQLICKPLDSTAATEQFYKVCPEMRDQQSELARDLIQLICDMTNPDPECRPTLVVVIEKLQEFGDILAIAENPKEQECEKPEYSDDCTDAWQAGIRMFSSPKPDSDVDALVKCASGEKNELII